MGNPALGPAEHFTYRHYLTWPEAERWELIAGQAWAMSPAPTSVHQAISGYLHGTLFAYLKDKACKVFSAPFDVLFPEGDEADEDVDTVVQPDILVYCDRSRITRRGGRGAPDLVVEILSPASSKKDLHEKFDLYERKGVREYWVVDPGNRSLQVFHRLASGAFDEGELREAHGDFSLIGSRILEGFILEPRELFAELD